ncbi:hypothetical protein [Bacillus sp. 1P06AnD]|uniref:hypothetical protein n=1 Tax=Bacillus sp. 1P06AnD TaxID=3132208 RepID=UPI0039A36679
MKGNGHDEKEVRRNKGSKWIYIARALGSVMINLAGFSLLALIVYFVYNLL